MTTTTQTPSSTTPAAPDKARTLGLNHVNLVVADIEVSSRFYQDALGLVPDHEQAGITFLTTPGAGDLLALQLPSEDLDRSRHAHREPGDAGGVDHIGFAVADADTLDRLVAAVEIHGGTPRARFTEPSGAFVTAFITDPDGYLIQLTAPVAGE
jgi:catechol 2,3-dioxygenase-like lactoylglutathione lyase family enzyme